MSGATDDIELFLCEDIEHADQVQAEIDKCRAGRPRLRIVGQARTFDGAKDALMDLERFPDIVLIDHHLRRGADAKPRPSALELASFIYTQRRREEQLTDTRLVLWTSSNDDQLFWTFRVCGGQHVMSKALNGWSERVELLYTVMEGAEWWPDRPALALPPSVRAVIRHFDAGIPNDEIATRLGIEPSVVSTRADELRKAVVGHFGQHVATGAHAMAAKARADGWVWVDLRDDRLLPTAPPLPLVLDPGMIPEP
ncbi:DNA-binding NarL/FixJ family response regulator [Solirubrobacter pauli]|uniref:DNA-binding NarL/FixJ family response regulator n=1 Tax=Solirubrobacter pauli TaxID=166793 RepID=A0A660LFB8_9ACTN|nr:winged helix-turn-helix domain-containing protein [Solirubrobacter pauli]RKQ93817.1 DNA-binding NarL/FixJ family response regulator [Solirubrobacter pauli]